jgi:hypothetical protein
VIFCLCLYPRDVLELALVLVLGMWEDAGYACMRNMGRGIFGWFGRWVLWYNFVAEQRHS